jgi:hypothetical protein
MSFVTDVVLSFGSLGVTFLLALGLRIGFRRGRNIGQP